ncbi:MAG: outer membrane beta-barrel protein [Proteobacteria bacterium]|nr:outer membrane beta-barrel protein [Pseudomonadota bacterium]
MTRTNRLLLSVAVAAALAVPAAARAADTGFYVGALIGQSNYDITIADVQPGAAIDISGLTGGVPASFTVDSTSLDKHGTGFGVTVGWQPIKYFAVEASYLDLGKATIDAAGTYQYGDSGNIPYTGRLEFKSRGPALAVVGILPFGQGWAVDARAGGYYGKTEYTVTISDATTTASGSDSKSNSHFMAGAGVSYTFGGNWQARLDYLHFNKVGDKDIYQTNVDLIAAGIRYRF